MSPSRRFDPWSLIWVGVFIVGGLTVAGIGRILWLGFAGTPTIAAAAAEARR